MSVPVVLWRRRPNLILERTVWHTESQTLPSLQTSGIQATRRLTSPEGPRTQALTLRIAPKRHQVYDDGYSGTITMECMNGGLRAWHSCYRSEVDIVAVVAITVAVMLVLGALFAAAVIALSRRRETKVVVPLTTLVAQAEVLHFSGVESHAIAVR